MLQLFNGSLSIGGIKVLEDTLYLSQQVILLYFTCKFLIARLMLNEFIDSLSSSLL